jgi:hypothetical protein
MSIARMLAALTLALGIASTASAAAVIDYASLQPLADYSPVTTFGSTPEVSVTTRTFNSDAGKTTYSSSLAFWNSGYSSLPAVVFAETDGRGGEVTLTPIAGFSVNLLSFQLGSHDAGTSGIGPSRTATLLRVVEVGTGTVMWDHGSPSVIVDSTRTLMPNVSSTAGLSVQWGYDWNIGLNNLTFEAIRAGGATVIPVPPAVALFLGGLALMGWATRKRN